MIGLSFYALSSDKGMIEAFPESCKKQRYTKPSRGDVLFTSEWMSPTEPAPAACCEVFELACGVSLLSESQAVMVKLSLTVSEARLYIVVRCWCRSWAAVGGDFDGCWKKEILEYVDVQERKQEDEEYQMRSEPKASDAYLRVGGRLELGLRSYNTPRVPSSDQQRDFGCLSCNCLLAWSEKDNSGHKWCFGVFSFKIHLSSIWSL
ncbi:hypothetical protein TcWFU_000812 [Taenia crassiceps]|uniref:Uncharacterized protein n=1 Tax=Taenia crassiceps TaxID=6207 RepID=A0ABR4Q6U2_9CEST